MSDPLPFVAAAAPDGSGWALALGSTEALDPELDPATGDGLRELLSAARPGLRTGTAGALPALFGSLRWPESGESLRLAVALFEHGRVFGLSALRPRRARGHDRDEIEAVVQEGDATRPVEDPRLSVTSGADGGPRRVGLELWLVVAEDEGYDFPRRAAGEVVGPPIELELDDLMADAHRVRWSSRGEAGSGWFVILRRR